LRFDRRFAEPIARGADIIAVIADLARQASLAMEQRGKGGRRFAVRLFRSDGALRDLAIETSQPTRDPALVARLFEERIDSLADPIDPGFGFDLVRLAVPVLETQAPTQLELDGGEVSDGELIALIDRLSTRLGRARVQRLTPRDTHIPEQAALALPAVEAPAPARWPAPAADEPPLRPIHLFDPPQPIEVIAEVPDGPPRQFRWRRTSHDVTRYEGPERIAAEWWKRDDNAGLTRDYYRIEDARGRRFWVFRHGLYREKERPRWYVHGLFA
jgi:protein ImuB